MHGDNGKLNILRCAGEALASGKAYQIVDKFFSHTHWRNLWLRFSENPRWISYRRLNNWIK